MSFTIKESRDYEGGGQFLRSLVFDGSQYEWSCTVAFEDQERQKPVAMGFYVWALGDPLEWDAHMAECLSKALGYPVVVKDSSSGNGHGWTRVIRT